MVERSFLTNSVEIILREIYSKKIYSTQKAFVNLVQGTPHLKIFVLKSIIAFATFVLVFQFLWLNYFQ